MAKANIDMINIRQILRLHSENTTKRQIEKLLGITRKTISKYIVLYDSTGMSYEQIKEKSNEELHTLFIEKEKPTGNRLDKLTSLLPYMEKELHRVGVSKFVLWEEYKRDDPRGYNYTQFCRHVSSYLKKNEATMHFEHKAGDKMFVDFTGKKLQITDRKTGEVSELEVFVAILGSSQMTYVEAVESQQKEDFIKASENAIHFFGGSPQAIVPDNLKSAVSKSSKYEPRLNEDFRDFALHYQTTILPTRSYKPRDKALVENAVRIVYSRIFAPLRNRIFFCITDLNEAIEEELEKHNKKNFQNKDFSRYDLFKEVEQLELKSLPAGKYEVKEYARLTVNKNCHIYLTCDKHYYSVPFRYIGKKVKVIYTKSHIEVYCAYKRICFHQRDRRLYKYSTIKEHLPSHHQFVSDWSLDYFVNWASGYGKETESYIREVIISKQHPEQGYKSCLGILAFGKKYGRQRLNNACKRAIHYNSYNYMTIKNILEKGLDKIVIKNNEQYRIPLHDNVRGGSYYN